MTVGNIGSVDVHQEMSESGFDWLKSSTRCGIIVTNVDMAWSGTWKCHLADTSSSAAGEQIRSCSYKCIDKSKYSLLVNRIT